MLCCHLSLQLIQLISVLLSQVRTALGCGPQLLSQSSRLRVHTNPILFHFVSFYFILFCFVYGDGMRISMVFIIMATMMMTMMMMLITIMTAMVILTRRTTKQKVVPKKQINKYRFAQAVFLSTTPHFFGTSSCYVGSLPLVLR